MNASINHNPSATLKAFGDLLEWLEPDTTYRSDLEWYAGQLGVKVTKKDNKTALCEKIIARLNELKALTRVVPDDSRLHKGVLYSYPTSLNAELFGFSETGCYTVQIQIDDEMTPARAVAAFATLKEAQEHAAKIPLPYASWQTGAPNRVDIYNTDPQVEVLCPSCAALKKDAAQE